MLTLDLEFGPIRPFGWPDHLFDGHEPQ